MQTFLPYPDFVCSAACLDMKRLGKQRVECIQIIKALRGDSKGWVNHPATRMWRGHIEALAQYAVTVCDEWTRRGYKDTCRDKITRLVPEYLDYAARLPAWLGRPEIHKSHRIALLCKDYVHYSAYGWDERYPRPTQYQYVWPVPM